MPGEYGTLSDYLRLYLSEGRKPEIPEWSDYDRGERSETRSWNPLYIITLSIAGPPGLVLLFELPSTATVLAVLSFILYFYCAVVAVTHYVTEPVHDWYEDIPRRGLAKVEFEYDTPGPATGVAD